MSTTPWRQIVTPHENIQQGRVRQNDFAASLADVLEGSGNEDYYDPERFFNRTFLTGGLRQLAGEVVGRLTGQGDGDAVMQIQTPFGGGKTHSLLCLYHLVKNGRTCFDHPALRDYWVGRGWKQSPDVPVAAFDGNQVGVGAVEVATSVSVQTMWGHIAWQLAGQQGYELIQNDDANRIAPGGETLDRLFEVSGGGLVILDEVVNYIEKAAGVAVQDSTLKAQTLTFLQVLSGRAGAHERVVVAATLPQSHLELHGTASAESLDRLQKIFGRVQKVREPVEGEEVHEIIRRRLFIPFGEDIEDKGVRTRKAGQRDDTIHAYVQDLKERPQVPEFVKELDYARRFKQSYPFHPNLLDVLNRYVGANPKFQRTRGVLRLLALVVADLVKKNHRGGLIQISDIDLRNEEIRSELLELVDREFRSALEADIIGENANSLELDRQQSPQMQQWGIASGIATTTFVYTCERGNGSRGATLAELHLASARPEIDNSTIPGTILQIRQSFHFINTEGDRYRFSTTPNLNRILLDAKNGVDDDQVRGRIEAELGKILSSKPLSRYIWPEVPSDIPDNNVNKLVVMPPEQTMGPSSGSETRRAVAEILTKSGSTHRTRRNTLVFLMADEAEVTTLKDRVRAALAAENVDTNRERHNLSNTQIAQLEDEKTNTARGVRQQLLRTYRHVAWGGSNGDPLKAEDMGQPPTSTDFTLTDVVIEFLKQKQKYLERLASMLLTHPTKFKVWPTEDATLSLKALPTYFSNFTHLPILKDDGVLKQAVADGVQTGHFALCEGTTEEDVAILHYKESISSEAVPLEEGYVLLRANLADDILARKAEEEAAKTAVGATAADTGATIAQPPPGVTVVDPPGGSTPDNDNPEGDGSPKVNQGQRVRLNVDVPFTDFHAFYTGIINALGRNSDRITINVSIEAESDSGFNSTVLEDTVKETLFNIYRSTDDLIVDE